MSGSFLVSEVFFCHVQAWSSLVIVVSSMKRPVGSHICGQAAKDNLPMSLDSLLAWSDEHNKEPDRPAETRLRAPPVRSTRLRT